jgi:hypothetical protein
MIWAIFVPKIQRGKRQAIKGFFHGDAIEKRGRRND